MTVPLFRAGDDARTVDDAALVERVKLFAERRDSEVERVVIVECAVVNVIAWLDDVHIETVAERVCVEVKAVGDSLSLYGSTHQSRCVPPNPANRYTPRGLSTPSGASTVKAAHSARLFGSALPLPAMTTPNIFASCVELT